MNQTRITTAFTANADGSEKLKPFFIGKANKPCCFDRKSGEQLGFYYRYNKKARTTGVLFQECIKQLEADTKLSECYIIIHQISCMLQ